MNSTLWTKEELLKAITGELIGEINDNFSSISIDSRSIKQNAIFFAIKGSNFDGHDFAQQAYNNGATILIVERAKASQLIEAKLPLFLVDDVMAALEELAIFSRKRSKAKIIAITGSLGKTSLKELLAKTLKLYGSTHFTYASYNNHWGVPLTLASMPRETQYGIFELGMNHSGELLKLGAFIKPDISVITAIAPAHIGNFDSIEDIAKAKGEIYINQKTDGLALINSDDKYSNFLSHIAKSLNILNIKFFGKNTKSDYWFNINEDKIKLYTKNVIIELNSIQEYIVYNIIATIAILDFLNLNINKSLSLFKEVEPLDGRGKVTYLPIDTGTFCLIDESYNANLTSMQQAIKHLVKLKTDKSVRKILVLGDMLELGVHSAQMHKELIEVIDNDIDFVYLIGKEMHNLAQLLEIQKKPYLWKAEVSQILPIITNNIKINDIIMLKSSNNIGTNKIVAALKEQYR